MIRLLHLSDVHLGASFSDFGAGADARRQEVLDAFRQLPQAAEAEGAQAVLIAGDLFDSPRPSDFVLAVVRQTLRRLVDSGCPVFVVPGNHDAINCNPALYSDLFGGAYVFRDPVFREPVTIETNGGPLHVYGLAYDWAQPAPLDTFKRTQASGAHVVLLHGCLSDMPDWRAYPNALRIPDEWLADVACDYLALGNSHAFRAPEPMGGRLRACYSGSFVTMDLRQPGPRGYVVADVGPGSLPLVEHRPSRARYAFDLGTFSVAGYADEFAIVDAIAEQVPNLAFPSVRLEGEPDRLLEADIVRAQLEKRFGAAMIDDATWCAASARLNDLAGQDTVASHVVRLGRRRIPEAASDPTAHILSERALRVALRSLRAEG